MDSAGTALGHLGVHLVKCLKECVCEQISVIVTCINKNLTEVPLTLSSPTPPTWLMGACGVQAHFSGEILETIHFRDLRCQSQEAMLKAEFEEQTRGISPPSPPTMSSVPPTVPARLRHHSSSENCSHTKVPHGFFPNTRLLNL
ncbi:uncharacterized protein ACWYII_026582 isoform 1-T2 [Salvelinus alpinus]